MILNRITIDSTNMLDIESSRVETINLILCQRFIIAFLFCTIVVTQQTTLHYRPRVQFRIIISNVCRSVVLFSETHQLVVIVMNQNNSQMLKRNLPSLCTASTEKGCRQKTFVYSSQS